MTVRVLKTVVFMGSARDMAAAWGGDSRLGTRVLEWVKSVLSARSEELGGETIKHDVTVFDPLDVFAKEGALATSGGELRHPHFFYRSGEAPSEMNAMADVIRAADCFLVVTAEYNHTIPPALSSMMGHFGGSCYAYKPSGIVTYSPGPWGGSRVAVALRPFLNLFEADGTPKDPSHRMLKQLPAMLSQLEWFAVALSNQKSAVGIPS